MTGRPTRTALSEARRHGVSVEAFILTALDAEGLTLAQQKTALHAALSTVIRKQMIETHERNVK